MSLLSLLKRSKTTRDPLVADKDVTERPSKTSKREFLRGLLKRDSTSRKKPPETELHPSGPSKSPSLDSNKPLPPAPPADINDAAPQEEPVEQPLASLLPPKPSNNFTKLLSEENIQKLFSGAPQFSLLKPSEDTDSDERFTPRPQVTFPWGNDLRIRETRDYVRFQHPAFSLATVRPDLPPADEISDDDAFGGAQPRYDIGAVEVPSMLAAQGLEPGTVGYEHFLTLPIADALEEVEDEGIMSGDEEDEQDDLVSWRRRKFIREGPENGKKIGVRSIEVSLIVGRLKELGELYHGSATRDGFKTVTLLKEQSSTELYTQLFTRLLYPPNHVHSADTDDPYSLKVQIEALVNVLRAAWIWHDFSIVERRIRLGQMLFGEGGIVETITEAGAERKWLLLQILLACELLVRLDSAVGVGSDEGLEITPKEIEHFNRLRRKKIDWDLILARRWLENVRLAEKESLAKTNLASPVKAAPAPKSWGWFSSAPTDAPANQKAAQQEVEYDAVILPRRQSRQLSGLILFAKTIGWSNTESLAAELTEKMQIPSALGTPARTPLSITSASSDYFPAHSNSQSGRDRRRARDGSRPLSRTEHLRHRLPGSVRSSALMRVVGGSGGWLSRPYFTSLVLPGEALSHYLMSTLLENDISAVEHLGFNVNLYGGFVYDGASWWSKSCIVGRVLAGLEGSDEVAGWIGGCIVPAEQADGWVDIRAETCRLGLGETPRVLDENCIGCLSEVAGEEDGARGGKVDPANFTLPVDRASDADTLHIAVDSLVFSDVDIGNPAPMDDGIDEGSLHTYDASIVFRIIHNDRLATNQEPTITSITTRLKYDIQFITAYPCSPPCSTAIVSSPSSQHQTSHPLHKSYPLLHKPLAELVSDVNDSLLPESKGAVWVIDASGSKDQEVFVRAWCADRGLSAIISRIGRTCLACSVREAKAVDVGVVARI